MCNNRRCAAFLIMVIYIYKNLEEYHLLPGRKSFMLMSGIRDTNGDPQQKRVECRGKKGSLEETKASIVHGREAIFRLLWEHWRFIKYVNHSMEEQLNICYIVPVSVHTIHQFIIWTSESNRLTGVWDKRCSCKILCLLGGNKSEAAKSWHDGKKGLSRLGHEQSCLRVRSDC